MSLMRTWKKSDKEDSDKPKTEPGKCMCYGCPMPGVLSKSTQGHTDDWICQIHLRLQPSNWQRATERMHQNMNLISLVIDLRLSMLGKQIELKGRLADLASNNLNEFLPKHIDRRGNGDLSMRLWQTRVERQLYDLVTNGLDVEEFDNKRPSNNAEMLMNRVDEWLKHHNLQAA